MIDCDTTDGTPPLSILLLPPPPCTGLVERGHLFGDRGNGLSTENISIRWLCAHQLCLRPTYRNKQAAKTDRCCHAVTWPCACPPVRPSAHAVVGIQCNGGIGWLVGWSWTMSTVSRFLKWNCGQSPLSAHPPTKSFLIASQPSADAVSLCGTAQLHSGAN